MSKTRSADSGRKRAVKLIAALGLFWRAQIEINPSDLARTYTVALLEGCHIKSGSSEDPRVGLDSNQSVMNVVTARIEAV